MSVIVKGMKMPKSCNECIMCVDGKYGDRCLLTNQYVESIIDSCPLVEIPEKHGSLISAKRIEFELCESNMPKQYRDFCRRVLNDENLTPTVVESEE